MGKLSLKTKMKRLRPFVTFNYDLRNNLDQTLTRQQKAEITKYYNRLAPNLSKKNVVYRPKRDDNISKAQKITGMKAGKFKAFPIPSPTGHGTVGWRGDEVVIGKKGAFVRTIYPDQTRLVLETETYLDEILSDDFFYIINSGNDWGGGGTKKATIAKLVAILEAYGWAEKIADQDPDDEEDEGKEIFTITLVEVQSRNAKSFLQYKQERRDVELAENEKNRKTRVRQRSRTRRRKAQGYKGRK